MLLTKKQLIGLPVRTKSGEKLGEIIDFELDADFQSIVNYIIKTKGLVKDLLPENLKRLVINRNQIVLLNDKELVIEDSVIKEESIRFVKIKTQEEAQPIMSEQGQ